MEHQVTSSTRLAERFLVVAFTVALWLPLLEMFAGFDKALPLTEKRVIANLPPRPTSAREVLEFHQRFAAFFRDNVGFRDRLIRIHHKFKAALFGTSPYAKILIGKDGWLFVNPSRYMNYYRGVSLMNEQELAAYSDCLAMRGKISHDRGARYAFIIAPNKETIYPEHLPKRFCRVSSKSRADQLVEVLMGSKSGAILDLRAELRNAKYQHPVYLKTDTHWNAAGAFHGYAKILSDLRTQISELGDFELPAVNFRPVRRDHPGDLAVALGLETLAENNDVTIDTSLLKARRVSVPQAYLKYQDKTHRSIEIFENPNVRAKRLVMFHDSFGELLRPLLAEHFERAVFINRPDISAFFAELIEMEHPTIVLDEAAEEHLMNSPPSTNMNVEE